MKKSGIKLNAKGKQMMNNPEKFFESFMHTNDSCNGQLKVELSNGVIFCDTCDKKTALDK